MYLNDYGAITWKDDFGWLGTFKSFIGPHKEARGRGKRPQRLAGLKIQRRGSIHDFDFGARRQTATRTQPCQHFLTTYKRYLAGGLAL